jgi:hypothetical protein
MPVNSPEARTESVNPTLYINWIVRQRDLVQNTQYSSAVIRPIKSRYFWFAYQHVAINLYSSYKEDRYDDVLLGAEAACGANELTYGAGAGAAAGMAHELAYE